MKLFKFSIIAATLVGLTACNTVEAPSKAQELQSRIDALEADIQSGKYGLIDEILLQHKGQTVFHLIFSNTYDDICIGKYLKGLPFFFVIPAWHPYYRDTSAHTLQSVSKSVTSILIGVLEEKGLISRVGDAKFLDFVDMRKYDIPNRDANFEALTLQHLLTMRDNFDWVENPDWGWHEDLDRIDEIDVSASDVVILEQETDNWIQYILNKGLKGAPGEDAPWSYNSGATQLMSVVIEHVTGLKASEFAHEQLFRPMGISDYYWKETNAGSNDMLGGLYLKSTDLVMFCELMTSGGLWNGKRLISEDYVNRSLTEWTDTFGDNEVWPPRAYGYQWWLSDPAFSGKKAFLASGYGGEYLTCLPESDTAMVTYSWNLPKVLDIDLDVHYRTAAWAVRKRVNDEILPLL